MLKRGVRAGPALLACCCIDVAVSTPAHCALVRAGRKRDEWGRAVAALLPPAASNVRGKLARGTFVTGTVGGVGVFTGATHGAFVLGHLRIASADGPIRAHNAGGLCSLVVVFAELTLRARGAPGTRAVFPQWAL